MVFLLSLGELSLPAFRQQAVSWKHTCRRQASHPEPTHPSQQVLTVRATGSCPQHPTPRYPHGARRWNCSH